MDNDLQSDQFVINYFYTYYNADVLIVTDEIIISKIHLIGHNKVMLDRDLAKLYGVTTGNLNKAVKRNLSRFPEDFMFQLAEEEFRNLIFQFGISRWGGTRKMPYAFTEQGVAMLSSVLKSDRAIAANIHIIRIFTRMRQMLLAHKDILVKLQELEKRILMQDGRLTKHEREMQMIFTALKELINPEVGPMRKIGFKRKEEEHSQSWCSICKEPLLLSPKKHAIGNQKTLLYHILRDDEKSGVGSHVGPDELSGMEPAEDRFDLKWRRGKRAGTYWCP